MAQVQLRRFILCALLIAAGIAAAGRPRAAAADATAGVSVEFDGRPLLVVRWAPPGVSVQERATLIARRLLTVAENPNIGIEAIQTRNVGQAAQIFAADVTLMFVTDEDGVLAGRDRSALAFDYASQMRDAVKRFREVRSWRSRALSALDAAILTALFVAILLTLRWLRRRADIAIERGRVSGTLGIRLQSAEVLRSDRLAKLLLRLTAGVYWGLILALLDGYIALLLRFFPGTEALRLTLKGLLLAPPAAIWNSFVGYLPSLFFVAVIAILTYLAVHLSDFIFSQINDGTIVFRGFHPDLAQPTAKLVRFILLVMALVAAFPYLPGSKSPAFQGVSILFGVLLSLGSSSAVANVISGVILIYMRPFLPGDRVSIAENVGDVVEKNLLVTRIRTVKNVIVTIPNAAVMGSHILNYSTSSKEVGLILHTTVTIGYDAPWRRVHELLIAAARSTSGILSQPPPFVLQTALDDFYVSYELNAYTAEANRMAAIYSELHENIQDKFNEGGVEINSPHYRAIRDGNQTTIPASYLSPAYRPPAFRFTADQQAIQHADLPSQQAKR
jgi:small-conductance mechanosensitive channel